MPFLSSAWVMTDPVVFSRYSIEYLVVQSLSAKVPVFCGDSALAEARRVLKPGGHFLCLEFSHVVLPLLRPLYDRYSFTILPLLGQMVTGNREAYSYLVESIQRFPDQSALCRRMTAAGFRVVMYRNLSGGIAAMHSGWRP